MRPAELPSQVDETLTGRAQLGTRSGGVGDAAQEPQGEGMTENRGRSGRPSLKADGSGGPGEEIRGLDRFLAELIGKLWEEVGGVLGITGAPPEFSGLFRVGDERLGPYLKEPGVFLVVGPEPALPLLYVGAAKEPMATALAAQIRREGPGEPHWSWEERSEPPPTYLACLAMPENWTFAPTLKSLLVHRLRPRLSVTTGQQPGRLRL